MKIGVVTIYNSQNCGSFLQAYALTSYLSELGYDARLVRNNMYYKNKFLYRLFMSIKYLMKINLTKAKNIFNTYIGFKNNRKIFTYFKNREEVDLYVFGSDTIWNVKEDYFNQEWRHYFGLCFIGNKISYAPSLGPTDVKDILGRNDICQCLKSYNAHSVRDDKTFELIKNVTGKDAEFVVDPTMLMDKSFYESMAKACPDDNYVLFYCFDTIPNETFEKIKKYSIANNLKLICFGENIKCCDKNLIFNPYLMMTYYKNATFVVTDTFHGNVFSIIFNKQFLNIERGKEKVTSLLSKFSLSSRTSHDVDDIEDIMSEMIDFETINKTLAEYSESSKNYLKTEISKIERRKSNAC